MTELLVSAQRESIIDYEGYEHHESQQANSFLNVESKSQLTGSSTSCPTDFGLNRFSSNSDINCPIQVQEKLSVDTGTYTQVNNRRKERVCNFPFFDPFGNKNQASTSNTDTPKPTIMSRPVSIRKHSFHKSPFSAFSSSVNRMSSPVPSIVTSDCSESSSPGHYIPICSPCSDKNDQDFVHNVRTANGKSYVEKVAYQSPNRSPRNDKLSLNSQMSPCMRYYFTPVPEVNQYNQLDYHHNADAFQARANYYPPPQCKDIPLRMSPYPQTFPIKNSTRNINMHPHRDSSLQHHTYVQSIPASFAHPLNDNSSKLAHFSKPRYDPPNVQSFQCQSTVTPNKFSKKPKNNDIYLSVAVSRQSVESKSTDCVDSIKSGCRSNSIKENPSSTSLLPQNLKSDPHRQGKVKTELCLHFARGRECPFGSRCNYAHGEHELKYTKLNELQRVGLVEDVKAYRTHPCMSWVTTGACPFGLRCNSIHDPRIASENLSWLPHSEVPVSPLRTELNVDKFFHMNFASLNQTNPMVHELLWNHRPSLKKKERSGAKQVTSDEAEVNAVEWKDTYSIVCNMANLYPWKKIPKPSSSNKCKKISELQRLCIAVHMSYSDTKPIHNNFIFKPKHLIYNELCMVLQTKYFRLLKSTQGEISKNGIMCSADTIVREIDVDEYKGCTSPCVKKFPFCPDDVVEVNELAFGCLGETVSKVSLWFDLTEIVPLSSQEIKRLKRNRQRKFLESNSQEEKVTPTSPFPGSSRPYDLGPSSSCSSSSIRSFESHPQKPFFHMRPISNDLVSHQFIQSILQHRISVLLRREFPGPNDTTKGKDLQQRERELQESFEGIKRDLALWKWPVSKGREEISDKTSIPSCSGKYKVSPKLNSGRRWGDFAAVLQSLSESKDERTCQHNNRSQSSKSSLCIFQDLSKGLPVSQNDRKLDHLKLGSNKDMTSDKDWASILLSNGSTANNDWDVIKEHYLGTNITTNKDKNMPLSPPHGDKASKQLNRL